MICTVWSRPYFLHICDWTIRIAHGSCHVVDPTCWYVAGLDAMDQLTRHVPLSKCMSIDIDCLLHIHAYTCILELDLAIVIKTNSTVVYHTTVG